MTVAMWTTLDGRKLPVRLMDSAHLVNAFNHIIAKNKLNKQTVHNLLRNGEASKNLVFKTMHNELVLRDLLEWSGAGGTIPQLIKTNRRETRVQLCMLAAMIDTGHLYPAGRLYGFNNDPQRVVDEVLRLAPTDKQWGTVVTKFVEHRLAFGV